MLREKGFYRGVNLGGWLSQCDYSTERMETFITREDIDRIAGWGLDHVRLPVDYNVVQDAQGFRQYGFEKIHKACTWCRQAGLKLVIDLHKTMGFSFDQAECETGFFEEEAYQEKFYALWEEMARQFAGDADHVALELLNEVTDPAYMDAWNRIAQTCLERIRRIAPEHIILVGGYYNNSAEAVPSIFLPQDRNVVYNFHCYDPLQFTHQGAPWVDGMDVNYRMPFSHSGVDETFFEKKFAPALEASAQRGVELYCGEYGVIDRANPRDMLAWTRTIHAVFEKYGLSRCMWSYKQMDFGISDTRLDGVRNELLSYL